MKKGRARKLIVLLLMLLGGAVVLAALSFLLSFVFKIEYLEIFKDARLYVIWAAALVVILGAALIDIRYRGSKRVLKVNADLETSHFMEKKEIERNEGFTLTTFDKLHNVNDGIPIHAVQSKKGRRMDIILKKPIHTLIIGTTGTGKTTATIEPMIEILARTKTKPSMVLTDPKGELYSNHGKSLEEQGYRVTIIDLADVYHSLRWNPFNDIWRKTDRMINAKVELKSGKYYFDGKAYLTETDAGTERESTICQLDNEIYTDLQDLIYTICPIENTVDSTWQKGARDLIFALALAFWEDVRDGYMKREQFNLYNLYRTITEYVRGECEELKEYFNNRPENSRTRGLSNTVLVSEDRTLSSYMGDVNQFFNWMADKGIAALTSGNEIEFGDFDESPNALFLKIPDEKENRYKLITLFITQMYKALIEKANNNKFSGKAKSQELLRNVYFIMDEFGNMPKFYKIDKIVTIGRSRRIFIVPVIQDFHQLKNVYGEEVSGILRSNCNIQIFVGTNDENTRKAFSALCGNKKVKQISYSENKDMSVSTSAHSVPLIYPNELEHLNDPEAKRFGNAIVSCLGNYPIRGKFTPFFMAQKTYKAESMPTRRGKFISFDEKAIQYDITKITAFLKCEDHILKHKNEDGAPNKAKEPAAREALPKKENSAKELAKKMLKDVVSRVERLKSKLSAAEYETLTTQDFRGMIRHLDMLADKAILLGNILLASEIEQVKGFILHRCFVPEEIKEIYKNSSAKDKK